jgi:hypothetical protein
MSLPGRHGAADLGRTALQSLTEGKQTCCGHAKIDANDPDQPWRSSAYCLNRGGRPNRLEAIVDEALAAKRAHIASIGSGRPRRSMMRLLRSQEPAST